VILGHHCQCLAKTGSDTTTAGLWLEPAVLGCMKIVAEFPHFWNSNSSNNLKWRNNETKVVSLEKLWKFVFDKFFIWICLGFQIFILKLNEHKMTRMNILNAHKCLIDGMVRGRTCEDWGQVRVLATTKRVLSHKKLWLVTCDGACVWLLSGVPPSKPNLWGVDTFFLCK
jgi:hypothetical protein